MLALVTPSHGFDLPSPAALAESVKASLLQSGLGSLGRTMSDMSGMSSMVVGGLSRLGYIPVMEAVEKCEGLARWRVEREIAR